MAMIRLKSPFPGGLTLRHGADQDSGDPLEWKPPRRTRKTHKPAFHSGKSQVVGILWGPDSFHFHFDILSKFRPRLALELSG
jgi:hypothetical protein